MGSSVGISKAGDRAELIAAINLAAEYDRKIMVEQGINAREVECSVLGNDNPIVSVVGEVRTRRRDFYDYVAKYTEGEADLIIPADIPPEKSEEVRALALRAYRAIDCSGMARADFFVDRDSGQVYLNELNTIPGFTKFSMYPKLWEASGLSYAELIDRLISLAFERYMDKKRSGL
jgi:D-alanine-D-alanine ligase